MSWIVPIPNKYKNKLDRYEFLLSRNCDNIAFFFIIHRDNPEYIEDPTFERLFCEAETAAMNYLEMQAHTKDCVLGNSLYVSAKITTERTKHHKYLIVSNFKQLCED